jgi:outer membrane protein, heavy metal efflux system
VPDDVEPREGLETVALEANLELAALKHRIESLARRAGVERLDGSLPSLVVDVHGLVGNPRNEPDDRDVRVSAGVTVEVPVFDRNQGTVASLVAEMEATIERYYGLAVDLRSAARDARNHLVSSHRRARHYQSVIVPAQRRVTEETMLQYNAMQIGIFQLLAAHREELDVRFAQVEARREFWTAMAAMEALLAGARVPAGGE